MKWLIKIVLNALALYIVAQILDGVALTDFGTAVMAVVVIAIVNVLVKPVLLILTLPITILTLGLFTFVINALMLLLTSALVPGFQVSGFLTALVASILLTIVSTLLSKLVI